jgi:prevent-host-death family protein
MKRATITETKNQLSAVLDSVRRGETVLILDRGQPIARIEPVTGDQSEDARVARLERSGAVRRAKHRLSKRLLDEAPPSPVRGASALAALLEERDQGR